MKIEIEQSRIENLLNVLIEYTTRDFTNQVELSEEEDEVDGIALGINTLGEELDYFTRELERKNVDLEQFVYITSHDLQEPLRTVSNFISLINEEYADKFDEQGKMYMKFVLDGTSRMQSLIKGLLDYSRLGKNKEIQLVDLNVLTQELVEDLDSLIKENNAKITIDTLPVIDGFPVEFKLLIQNLLNNAIKFRKPNTPPEIKIWSERDKDGKLLIIVQDNGIGIDKQYLDKIFVIFQRLNPRSAYQGNGIGLSHAKRIVDLHKGDIWAESELGKGTTFFIRLPQ